MSQTSPVFAPGQQVAHYTVERRLARGGLGTIYLASDTRLHRKVVLKVLNGSSRAGAANDDLLREARAAAALNHPNIVSVFELFEAQGHLVMVMEWVEGESLSSRSGRVSIPELTRVAQDLTAALTAAHRAGVIHGDIKPANVIVATDGHVRLLDFGIARRADELPQTDEQFAGTVPYMSPEVIRGAELSVQSDLWALGVLLFELATGTRPFTGDYEAAIQYSIMHTRAAPVRTLRPELPLELARIIDKLLAAKLDVRYADTEQLAADLQRVAGSGRRERPRFARQKLVFAASTVLLAGAVALAVYLQGPPSHSTRGRVLAVLPFDNLGDSTQNYFAEGMSDALISILSSETLFSVISRGSSSSYKRSRLPLKSIADQLSSDFLVTGALQREGDPSSGRLLVTASLSSGERGQTLWTRQYDEPAAGLFRIHERIANDIRSTLGLGSDSARAPSQTTDNLGAYDLYLRGNDYYNRGWSQDGIRFAIDKYSEAVQADSNFAPAWAMLARGHASMYWEYFDRSSKRCEDARRAAQRALKLNSELADAHLAMGYCHYQCELDFARAIQSFQRALELEPKNAEVLNAMAAVERRQFNLSTAAEHFKASLELDPLSHLKAFDVGLTYGLMRKYGDAHRYLDRSIALAPDFDLAHIYKAWLAILERGDRAEARAILARAAPGAKLIRNHYYWWLQRIVSPDLSALLEQVPALDDTAACFLFKSQIHRLLKHTASQRAYADSARAWILPRQASAPQAARYQSYLGLAYAYLGQKDQAIEAGGRAVSEQPTYRDAFEALFLAVNMAEILVVVGEPDLAVAQLDGMLSMPGFVTIAYFKCDPLWEPLRENAQFQKLGAPGS